ncbi:hypothetical protein [Agrococcus sp. DT81.2]|uniref:hypothetical protein n=1 Tax=Agrococcus sp. DT81.2 TaxID=3393414 RepID=UPI003CE51C05
MSTIRILLADPTPALELVVSSAVARHPDLAVVGRATGNVQLLLQAAQADVVLLETEGAALPAIAESLTDEYPHIGVVAIDAASHLAIVYQLRGHAERVSGSDAEQLVAAIRSAASGDLPLIDISENELSRRDHE